MTETRTPVEPAPGGGSLGDRLADVPGPLATAGRLWRRLRRMSTALWLLFMLAAATIVATFVPQEPVIPPTVAAWRTGTEGPGVAVASLLDAAGLFDVYGSWWFMLLTGLLVVSLTGCLSLRWRAWLRVVRTPPPPGHRLARLRASAAFASPLPPAEAAEAARRLLRRRRFRVRVVPADEAPGGALQVAGERGHAREGSSILFHTSFYVLFAGALIGQAFGFTGQVNVVEGSSFAETAIAYGGYEPGRYWGLEDHRGFGVRLDEFAVAYHDPPPDADADPDRPVGLVPSDFASRVTFVEDGRDVATREVRVNHPVAYDGLNLYQARFGYAPSVEVRASGGGALFADEVLLTEQGIGVWAGVAKVASTDPEQQIALELVLLTDAAFTSEGVPFSRSPRVGDPRLAVVLWYGELGLERNVPASEFDREAGRRVAQPLILAPGETAAFGDLPLEVTFRDLPHWSGFQVSHEPGRRVLLVGAILLLAGLLGSLYAYRRRVWVEVAPRGTGSAVRVAGVALQRKSTFEEAFPRLRDDLRRRLAAPDDTGGHDIERHDLGSDGPST